MTQAYMIDILTTIFNVTPSLKNNRNNIGR